MYRSSKTGEQGRGGGGGGVGGEVGGGGKKYSKFCHVLFLSRSVF